MKNENVHFIATELIFTTWRHTPTIDRLYTQMSGALAQICSGLYYRSKRLAFA